MSHILNISDHRSCLKIETLHGKNSTEIHGVLSGVCGELTVDFSMVSHWTNHFCVSCVSINKDPRPGRPKISSDDRSVNLEDCRAICEELSRGTGVPATSVFRV